MTACDGQCSSATWREPGMLITWTCPGSRQAGRTRSPMRRSAREDNPVPHIELNLAPTGEDMQEMALALMRAIIAAADQDKDEITVLLIHGEPAAVIAPYGHERRPGATAEIAFDQTAPPEARLVLKDTWGASIRMSTGEFRQLARAGVSPRFEAMAQIAESVP
jgi:hypothetical protein